MIAAASSGVFAISSGEIFLTMYAFPVPPLTTGTRPAYIASKIEIPAGSIRAGDA